MGRLTPPVLRIEKLSIHRGPTAIIRELDWFVGAQEHWVILGANGSGKTSLLAALTGYLTPSGGTIEVLGERYGESDWRKLRERVGIVSSAVRQKVPDWDTAELVVIGGRYAMLDYWGRVKRSDRIGAARELARVGCAAIATREWRVLSQGERQRVLIARALIAKPALLILDEPCAGLDPVAREKFLAFIQRLASKRRAPRILFVTHHVEEITPDFTHALLLKGGRAIASGKIGAVLNGKNVGATFGAALRLRRRGGRFAIENS